MKLSQKALNKIAVAAKLGKSADIQVAVDEALAGTNTKRHWKEEVREWIVVSDSYWNVRVLYIELGAVSKNDKGAIVELPYGIEGFATTRHLAKEEVYRRSIIDYAGGKLCRGFTGPSGTDLLFIS